MFRSLQHLAVLAVLATGLAAAVLGFARIALLVDLGRASVLAALGLALVAWVIFHPARLPDDAPL